MERTFTIRIDLESHKGIKEGLPKLLDLMKKWRIKGSFYLVMGGESNLIELLKYRKHLKFSEERKIKLWSIREKIRMALLPKDFVKIHLKVLKRIIDEGHELGLHGWKHRAWTRAFDEINLSNHIKRSIKRYRALFRRDPISFSAPGFSTNSKVLRILKQNNIKFVSDFEGKLCQDYEGIRNVPMTILGKNCMPIIEYMVGKRKSDKEIIEHIKEEIDKNQLSSIYLHGLFEARFKLNILEEIFKHIKKNKIKNKKIIDYG